MARRDASPILNGLSVSKVDVKYLGADGVTEATGGDSKYVRVSITGYEHRLRIPFVSDYVRTLEADVFTSSTTIPAESLGYAPPGLNPCT